MSSVGLNSIQESEALIHDMLREASSRVNGAKRELEHLQIPKLKKFLQSISRLLDSCMKLKGGEATIKPIAVILMRVDDTILQPILDASRHGELQISESLAEQLQDFFSKVSSLFQPRSPSFTLNYMDQWLGGGGVGPMLSDICPKIEESLKAFQSNGNIESETTQSGNHQISWIWQSGEVANEQTLDSAVLVKGRLRFRILLLGKSGVGKSSLINSIFKIPLTDVVAYRRGGAYIDTEIWSDSNPYFVFHDSMGYESGSTEYFRIVEHFVRKRANECLLSEKLHAIWLLASVPYSGGRVFEIGDVDMMKMALEYRIPLVVVFTKYDLLVTQTEIEMTDSLDDSTPDPPTAEEIKKEASVNADDVFRRTCITPLREMPLTGWNLPSPPPYTRVSIMTGYENTLMELVKLTERNIPKALWLTWASAQRIDTQTSIKAFIARLFQSSRDESNYQQATMAGTLMCEAINVTGRLKKAGKTPVAIGGNSDVWKGSLRDTGRMNLKRQPVAIKVLRNVRIRSREDTTARMLTRLQREIRVWEQLSHENVVPLLGFAFEDQSPCMVAPWYENGTVLNYINVKPSANRSKLSLNVLDGLIYMHSFDSPIIHGDLRGSNILVDDRGCARISDFGLSRICQDGPSGYTTSSVTQGSARWMAPELFRHDKRTIASDMYAYGLVAMEICSGGTIPFRHLSHLEFLAAIVQEASPKRVHYGLTDLPEHILLALEATWSWNPDDRPSAIDMRAMCTRPSIIQTS